MFKNDELKLDIRQGTGWAHVTGEKPDEISSLTNQRQEHKNPRGCNLRVKGIKSQEVCGEVWIKGQLKHRKNEAFTVQGYV